MYSFLRRNFSGADLQSVLGSQNVSSILMEKNSQWMETMTTRHLNIILGLLSNIIHIGGDLKMWFIMGELCLYKKIYEKCCTYLDI